MSVKMTDKDGNVITKIVETEVPEVTEFGNPETFYEVFDRFEKPVIEARNQIGEELTKVYLEEAVNASKKGAKPETVKSKEKLEESQSMGEMRLFRNISRKKEF